jgi:hypothetical protein
MHAWRAQVRLGRVHCVRALLRLHPANLNDLDTHGHTAVAYAAYMMARWVQALKGLNGSTRHHPLPWRPGRP